MQLVLASTSPYRRELVARLGIPFSARAPACDEEALKRPDVPGPELASLLAHAKAASVWDETAPALMKVDVREHW